MTNKDISEEKIVATLCFEHSDVWDVVMHILNKQIDFELGGAIGAQDNEANRAHSCGRVDGLISFRELLKDTKSASEDHVRGR